MNKTIGRSLVTTAIVTALVLAWAMPAIAIQFGTHDTGHDYVCMLHGPEDWQVGTGFQISPTVVVTAGHATSEVEGSYVDVYFSDSPDVARPDMRSSEIHTMAEVTIGNPDVGVVILPRPHPLDAYATLPPAGCVPTLRSMQPLDLVGYGLNSKDMNDPDPGLYAPWVWLCERQSAMSAVIQNQWVYRFWNDQVVEFTGNHGVNAGAIGGGDSGGPVLLRGTDTVLGLMAYTHATGLNGNGMGVMFGQRLDLPDVLAWIESFED